MIIITFSIGASVLLGNTYVASIKDSKSATLLESKLMAQKIENIIENISLQLFEFRDELNLLSKKNIIEKEDTIAFIKKIYELNPNIEGLFIFTNTYKISYYGKRVRELEPKHALEYVLTKNKQQVISLTKPHYHIINGKKKLIISIVVPLNNKIQGVIGADISLTTLHKIVEEINFKDSYSFLFSNKGTIIAHTTRPELTLKNIDSYYKIISAISKKELDKTHSFFAYSTSTNQQVLRTLVPIPIKYTDRYWILSTNTPKSKILESFYLNAKYISLTLLALIIIIVSANSFALSRLISSRLYTIVKYLNELAKGNFNKDIPTSIINDEIGKLQNTSIELKNDLLRLISKIELKDTELSFSKTILQRTIDEFDAGIMIASAPDGKIFAYNKKSMEISRATENDELIITEFETHPEYWNTTDKKGNPINSTNLPLARSIFKGESVKNEEITVNPQNKGKVDLLVNSAPIYDKRGKIIAAIAVFLESTEATDIKPTLVDITRKITSKLDGIIMAPEDLESIKLTDLVRVEKLQSIQDNFANAFDVASIITDTDGVPITEASNFCKVCDIVRSTEAGSQKCFASDKTIGDKAYKTMKPSFEECHSCGFIDAGAPIVVGGKFIGIWMIGQVDTSGSKKRIENYAKEIGANVDSMLKAYSEMPERIPIDKFQKVVDFLWVMANEISHMGYNNLLLAQDLEKTKALEKALNTERKNLEKTVRERTKELEESLISLEKANQHKNNFLSTMSHELRTPLNAIIGFTDLLNKKYYGDLNDKQTEYTGLIGDSSKHLLDLINDILDITKIDSGSIEITKESINTQEFSQDIIATMLPQYRDKRIKLDSSIDETIKSLFLDKRKTKQVLLNLLSNSLKFTPENGTVELTIELQDEDTLLFSVIDSGIGIAEEELDNVFKEFYQIDKDNLQASGGTGIGLALAKRLIELQGGEIGVISKPGKGSTFWFTLPINN